MAFNFIRLGMVGRLGIIGLAVALGPWLAAGAGAQGGDAETLREYQAAEEYQACMTLARRVPEQGLESALAWIGEGGGAPAQHCAAVAQIELKDYRGAGERLEKAATTIPKDEAGLAAGLLGQAGQAWFLAGDLDHAAAAQTAALVLAPDNVDLLVDRAFTLATAENYWEAIDDLNRARELAPRRADILVYRAAAYRYVDGMDLAREDIAQALELAPDNPDALLERGTLRRLAGDAAGARADWLKVVSLAKATPVADAARANIEKLDLKTE
jgi:tetratricopeptide (TPR) repeat protein